jgi:hypothetical protein
MSNRWAGVTIDCADVEKGEATYAVAFVLGTVACTTMSEQGACGSVRARPLRICAARCVFSYSQRRDSAQGLLPSGLGVCVQ